MAKEDIYFESGANDFQMLGFIVGEQKFGVNSAKIKQILEFKPQNLTSGPNSSNSYLGVYLYKESTFPLIDLKGYLEITEDCNTDIKIILLTEFNNTLTGFLIDDVIRIYRISWKDISDINDYLLSLDTIVTGSVNVDNMDILILDFEYILSELNENTRIKYAEIKKEEALPKKNSREQIKIFFAEDSAIIRNIVIKSLSEAFYSNIVSFSNGHDCYDKILSIVNNKKTKLSDNVNLLLTDIEMPKMNGLTLCKKIKKDLKLDLPVIIFSSLINRQMISKCKNVGADNQVSKPQIEKIIELIDLYCLDNKVK